MEGLLQYPKKCEFWLMKWSSLIQKNHFEFSNYFKNGDNNKRLTI